QRYVHPPAPVPTPDSPILVTGAHRSGTTWVGQMLAAAPGVGYIKEPFNLGHRPGVCTARFPYWFTHVTGRSDPAYAEALARTLAFDYDVPAELRVVRRPRDVARLARDGAHALRHRLRGSRPLMKDPI